MTMHEEAEGTLIHIERPSDSWRLRAYAWALDQERFTEFPNFQELEAWISDAQEWAEYAQVEFQQGPKISILWKVEGGKVGEFNKTLALECEQTTQGR